MEALQKEKKRPYREFPLSEDASLLMVANPEPRRVEAREMLNMDWERFLNSSSSDKGSFEYSGEFSGLLYNQTL